MKNILSRGKIVPAIDGVIYFCLCGLVFMLPISIAGVEVFAYLGIAVFFLKKVIKPDFGFIKDYIFLPLFIFAVFCGLSLLNSGTFFNISLHALLFKWLRGMLVFIIIIDNLKSRKTAGILLAVFLFSAGLTVIDSLSQIALGREFLRGRDLIKINENISAITGPFKHYNNLGAYLVVVLSLLASLSLNSKFSGFKKIIIVLFGVLTAACLILTFSRGSWIGFFGSGLLMLPLSRKYKILLLSGGFFILLMFLFPAARERAAYTFSSGGDASRFAIWTGALGMAMDHPFIGSGLGTFMSHFPHYTKGLGIQYAHNCFLQMLAETGVFALLSFLAFVLLIFRRGISVFVKTRDYIVLGLICAIFGYLIHSFFDNHLYSLQLMVLFWFLCGLLVAVAKMTLYPQTAGQL